MLLIAKAVTALCGACARCRLYKGLTVSTGVVLACLVLGISLICALSGPCSSTGRLLFSKHSLLGKPGSMA